MKEKKLLNALNGVDDQFIEEAAPEATAAVTKKKISRSRLILKWGSMAACVVLVLSVALTVPGMLFSGCGATGGKADMAPSKDGGYSAGYGTMDGFADEMPMEEPAGGADDAYEEDAAADVETMTDTSESAYQRANVKLIRTANLDMETLDFDGAVKSLQALVDSLGGYVEDSSLYQGSYSYSTRSASYTVRIPSEHYDAFVSGVGDHTGCHLTRKSESTEDVGQAYFDTETHLTTLRTKLERLQALLKKAEKMADIIELESAISDTEYEINRYTSTLNHYDSLVGFATIGVVIDEVKNVSDSDQMGFGERLGNAFVSGWQSFVIACQDVVLAIAENLFGLIVAAAVICGIVLIFKRVRKKK